MVSGVVFALFPAAGIVVMQLLGVAAGVGSYALGFEVARHLATNRWVALFSVSLWWLLPQTILLTLNGQETSLALFGALLVWWRVLAMEHDASLRNASLLGAACGIAVLGRIDLIVLVGLVGIWMLGPARRRGVFICVASGLIVLLPWLVFTLSYGMSPLPESGGALRTLAEVGGERLDLGFQLQAFLFVWNNLAFVPPPLGVIVLGLLMYQSLKATPRQRLCIVLFCLWLLGTAAAYALMTPASWFYARYALPTAQVFGLMGVAWSLQTLTKQHTFRRGIVLGALGLLMGTTFLNAHLGADLRWMWFGQHGLVEQMDTAAQWLDTNTPQDTIVGAFQTGLLAYSTKRTVINLDGKVNREASEAQAQYALWRYICAANIDFVVDFRSVVETSFARDATWRAEYTPMIETFPGNLPDNLTTTIYRVERDYCTN